MKDPFVLSEASRPVLDTIFLFLSNGHLELRSWPKFCVSEFLAMDQEFSRRHVIAFDALIRHVISVVYVGALTWAKEGRDNKRMEKTK
jgi:hypothetical protein